uniref:NF-kappa-B inhibitor-interacting Ras-like protein 1 n=1 Tax=Geotrypetes seraphini TaxID=260995 RepID=A0A6P8QGD4_GEOSA|nr:NF-kappa-B inhibitor-interacting Ras-like protein 1 [Geotrypetes seraphini]XP_033785840.1 NF-kappa-B inhibitor-interacting Ras-like protein 1 [Geotrypetes seraphini]XP_033785841.1 NF-kappa-B inhibitor-interacting Ras-like protein 1 [Geotrypetes seraphini]XP_033785842.1 NF-kappa-B inhibitor-interacting Ras-like protein 1 [Geotrypetes seraphini]
MGKGCKVVVCGLSSVGKTAILEQLLYGNHIVGLESSETLEDVYIASVETDRGVKEQLRLYDTRGLQDGVELPKHYFSFADGFVLVYSVNSLESFRRIELLKKEVDKFRDKKEMTIVVLGNKIDLTDQKQVDTEMAQQWAKSEKLKLWELSFAFCCEASKQTEQKQPNSILAQYRTTKQYTSQIPNSANEEEQKSNQQKESRKVFRRRERAKT